MEDDYKWWPFAISEPEADWGEIQRDQVEFMRIAFAAGYRPRVHIGGAIDADGVPGRSSSLVFRGVRNGWEPFLTDSGRSVRLGPVYGLPLGESACVCVRPPFRAASYFALEWLRGRKLESLLQDFEFVGGYPAGIKTRDAPARLVLASGDRNDGV